MIINAREGDWLMLPPAPGEGHGRRGQILALMHPDGSPPFRVQWLEDEHVSVVFPPPGAHVEPPHAARPVAADVVG